MEKICGACSKEKGMLKEKRIEIAFSRIPNQVYQCPECKQEHSYQINASKKVMIIQETIHQEPKAEKTEKKQRKKKENQPEQLALF